MPGPGGGGRGGGFGGGGFGKSPGGFGGPRPGGFYRPLFGFYRPFWGYGYGGGCLGGFLGMMLAPIFLLVFSFYLITSVFGSFGASISNVASGGQILYEEPVMQDYADRQYAIEFADSVEYEDNILIVFLINEKYDGYYTIAWVGDNIKSEINNMFGNEYTEFGREMKENIAPYYENSLSKNLATAVNGMAERIHLLNLDSSFEKDKGSPGEFKSHLSNNSSLPVNEETINSSLEEFTSKTDIPFVIVIDDIDNVFERKINSGDVIILIFAVALSGGSIYLLIRAFKRRSKERRNNDDH